MFKIAAVGILGTESDINVLAVKRILMEFKVPFEIICGTGIEIKMFDYPLLFILNENDILNYYEKLNDFLNTGGNIIFCGSIHTKEKKIFDISFKENITHLKFKLKFENHHPIVNNIENREIFVINSEITLMKNCIGYDIIGTFIYNNHEYPAIIFNKRKNIIFIPFDLCKQVVLWETEQYAKVQESRFSNFLNKIYNKLSYNHKNNLKSLARKVRIQVSKKRTNYTSCPIEYNSDTIRILLQNCIIHLFLCSIGFLPTLSKWPHGHKATMAITHDIDTIEDYEDGLITLLKIEEKNNIIATWNFVAQSSEYKLQPELLSYLVSKNHEVACHGLYHDIPCDKINRKEIEQRMVKAKTIIENNLNNYKVNGFRSPGLIRTNNLLLLIEKSNFKYDMSYPDTDHYTLSRYGMGVSSHIPYLPILKINNEYKELKVLELPLAALQEANLFIDHKLNEKDAMGVWIKKGESIIRDGGLVIFLFHPSRFISESRSKMYDELLAYYMRKKDLWITTANNVVFWWNARRNINIFTNLQGKNSCNIILYNKNKYNVKGLILMIYVQNNKKIKTINGNTFHGIYEKLKWYDIYYVNIPSLSNNSNQEIIITFEN